jgi:hypothetical protein
MEKMERASNSRLLWKQWIIIGFDVNEENVNCYCFPVHRVKTNGRENYGITIEELYLNNSCPAELSSIFFPLHLIHTKRLL